MGKKIPSDIEAKTVRAYLNGMSRDETASRNNVSGGYVSDKWDDFKKLLGPEGEALRELSIKLKRSGITAEKAITGSQIALLLKQLRIEDNMLQEFLTKVYNASSDRGYEPEQIVEYSIRLFDLYSRMGMDYEQIIKKYETTEQELTELQEQIKLLDVQSEKYKVESDKTYREMNEALRQKKLEVETLNEYLRVKGELSSLGQNIEDTPKFGNMLRNSREQGYDPNKIVESISEIESLYKRIEDLEIEVANLEKGKTNLENKIGELNRTKLETEDSIKSIRENAIINIRQTSQEANKLLAQLRDEVQTDLKKAKSDVETSVENLENSIESEIARMNQNAKDRISEVQSKANESLGKLSQTLDKVNPAIEKLSKAEEVGEQIGKLETLSPLFKLLFEAKGAKHEILPITRIILDKFRAWLGRYPDLADLREKTDTLVSSMDEEIET